MTLQPPFALFVLSPNIDTEYLNYSLRRAWRGNFMAGWEFWVATDNYGDIPATNKNNESVQGTVAPIRGSFTSPWIGKQLRDCARWLQAASSDVAVNRRYFAAMDEHSKSDDTVLVCRVVKSGKTGEVEVECFPQSTDVVAVNMVTNGDAKFEEKAATYRKSRVKEGKPDRSRLSK